MFYATRWCSTRPRLQLEVVVGMLTMGIQYFDNERGLSLAIVLHGKSCNEPVNLDLERTLTAFVLCPIFNSKCLYILFVIVCNLIRSRTRLTWQPMSRVSAKTTRLSKRKIAWLND